MAAVSVSLNSYRSASFPPASSSSSTRRNSASVVPSGSSGFRLVTRERTEETPFPASFSALTAKATWTAERSESNRMVPWCMTRPSRMYWALPENFFPSAVTSFRPLISAGTPKRASVRTTGRQNRARSTLPPGSASVMTVKFRLPRSW